VRVQAHILRADAATLPALLVGADVVLDCSDNRATRFALNRAARMARVALVSGAASAFAGQLAVFDFRTRPSPCYACLFPEDAGADDSCATMGVFAPLTGVIGALQAGEALKLVCGIAGAPEPALLLVDALGTEFRRMAFASDPHCPVCAAANAAAAV